MINVISVLLTSLIISHVTFGALDSNFKFEEQLDKQRNRVKRVAEGNVTGVKEFAWTAYLDIYLSNSSHRIASFCGGSLIHDFYVLTAAHCLVQTGFKIDRIQVHLAAHNKKTWPYKNSMHNKVEAQGFKLHPQFNRQHLHNDIALIKIRGDVPTTKYAPQINLPHININTKQYTDYPLRVVGWGSNGSHYPDVKHSALLNLVPDETCKSSFYSVIDSQLCAMGHKGEMSCEGDSGGPLVAMTSSGYIQVGIVSGGTNPCKTGPALFTNVYYFLDWIRQTIAAMRKNKFEHLWK